MRKALVAGIAFLFTGAFILTGMFYVFHVDIVWHHEDIFLQNMLVPKPQYGLKLCCPDGR